MLRICLRIRKFLIFYAVIFIILFIFFSIRFLASENYSESTKILNNEEKQIQEYESRIIPGLGAEGKAAYLTGEDKILGELASKSVAMNTILSDRIPLNRTLKDTRYEGCRDIKYDLHRDASVVLIFHEEPFSVVLRTVWSILLQSPKHLIHEIILVDDFSKNNVALGKRLEHYIATRLKDYPVKLIRTKERLGLIRARLAGARVATGEILVFLDAHCECTKYWLEPLIARIEHDPRIVAIPIIDVIEANTFKYSTNGLLFQIGGFTWSGHFNWIDVPERQVKKRLSESDPVETPTMAGGLFAMERAYFWQSGSYDEQMDGWGGENLEMSFRIWQCGGKMEQIPCSRVGHVFRDFHPYHFPNSKDTHAINTARLAKVWMDEFADLYFLHQSKYKDTNAIGDLTHRKELRKKLECKPFSWYLDNVFPEKFIPIRNVINYGQIRTYGNLCLDDMQISSDSTGPLGLYPCHPKLTPSQLFSLTKNNELREEEHCSEVMLKMTVQLVKCHGKRGMQEWILNENGMLKNTGSGKCLSSEGVDNLQMIVQKCDSKNKYQKWEFLNQMD